MLRVGIFNVRVVLPGDRYGKDDALVNDGDPLVEFYDATQCTDKFGLRGQFISRYYLSTITAPGVHGMCLHGDVPAWRVTDEQMSKVRAYLIGFFEGRAR